MKSSALSPHAHSASYKEVRFSHPLVPMRRTRSVASSNPLLDPAHQAVRAAKKSSGEYATYIEQSRLLLESQRLSFEHERRIFAEERKLWDMERAMLKSRIAELESALIGNLQVTNFTTSGADYLRPELALKRDSISFDVWQPNGSRNGQIENQHHVWEGPILGSRPATRVFPDENGKRDLYIPPTEANGFGFRASLDAALSPQLFDRVAEVSVPVPIEKVDSELDGITLKSTALPPDIVAKVMTPPTSLSPSSSPPKAETETEIETESSKQASEGKSPLKLKLSDLGPPDVNLTRDAGHTPMAILGTETEASTMSPSTELPEEEAPLAPAVTKQPIEAGDSYFPAVDEDPALKGPLTLSNEAEADSSFLSELDKKLLDEAKKAVSGPPATEDVEEDSEGEKEAEPELKLRPSTNFGTAFGQAF